MASKCGQPQSGVPRNDITCSVLRDDNSVVFPPSLLTDFFRPDIDWAERATAFRIYHCTFSGPTDSASCQPCRDVGEFSETDRVIQMEIQSPSSSNATDKGENQKQAACLRCRQSKTRCLRDAGDVKCKKCAQTQAECIVPEYRVGRKKGIKKQVILGS